MEIQLKEVQHLKSLSRPCGFFHSSCIWNAKTCSVWISTKTWSRSSEYSRCTFLHICDLLQTWAEERVKKTAPKFQHVQWVPKKLAVILHAKKNGWGWGHFWRTLWGKETNVHERTLSVLKSPSNPVRVSRHGAIKIKYRPGSSFTVHYSVNLRTETSFKIRPFENMRRWCWLLIREWLGKAGFTTAKLNRIQHMLLYHLGFFYVSFLLSRIHTWPQMLALCVWRSGKVKGNDVILPTCSDTSSFFICYCFQLHKHMYPIAHTLVSLIPWGYEIVKHTVAPLHWSPQYSKVSIQNLSLTHSQSSSPDSNPTEEHLSISREKVSIATPHLSSRSMSSGTRCQERVW